MIEGLKPYVQYRPSLVPWVPVLPSHWQLERAKSLFSKVDRSVRAQDEVVTCFRDGTVTLRKNRRVRGFTEAIQEHGYQGIRKGDLVIHAMDAFAGAIGISDSDGKGTPVYIVCQPRTGIYAAYYAHCLREMARANWILALSRGIRERSTDFRFDVFGPQRLPIPSFEEQAAIVRFLNHANRRIDRFIRAKTKLIALLNEQKQAIIHRAVTRGLDPNVPMKDSGILGTEKIPEHWELLRIKQLCSTIIDCKNRTPNRVDGGDFTVVRTTNVRRGQFNLRGSYPTDAVNYAIWTERGAPRIGDVFFTREAPAGEACLVPDIPRLCMGQRMMYLRPRTDVLDARFLLLNIYGPIVRSYIEHACHGSTVGHLRLGQVSSIPIPWCPIDEQIRITEHVDFVSKPINIAVEQAEKEIALVREYRTRLIADVVTGQLDVREAVKGLPVEDGDDGAPVDAGDEIDEAEIDNSEQGEAA